MKFRTAAFLLILTLLSLAGCSANRFSAYRKISGFRQMDRLDFSGSYDKALSDPRSGTIFAMRKDTQEIHIFRGGQRINVIGGLGFERTNFQRLSDIGVDSDGGLLALDSAQKILRKFTPEGGVVAELSFSGLRQPELFCVGLDGTLFLYDAATTEIVCYSQLDNSELYRFPRFVLEQPVWISCNHDYVFSYSQVKGQTDVFYILGQYKETLAGQVLFDPFNNPIRTGDVVPVYVSTLPKLLSLNSETLVLLYDNYIQTYRIDYERGADATQ